MEVSIQLLDRFLSTAAELSDARGRARSALRSFGDEAEAHLLRKLDDPRRRRSRRAIRLAIRMLPEERRTSEG